MCNKHYYNRMDFDDLKEFKRLNNFLNLTNVDYFNNYKMNYVNDVLMLSVLFTFGIVIFNKK